MPNDLAAPAPACCGAWHAPADDLAQVLAGPALAALDELGVIAVRGADAIAFLQSQLTNDSAGLDAIRVQLNGYCTAKGRLLAVFDQWRDADTVCLQLPAEILDRVMKRLSMFVLRARATLEDASAQWRTFALLGPGAAQRVRSAWGAVPEPGATIAAGDLRISRLPDGTRSVERFMLRAPAACADAALGPLAGVRRVASGAWWWSQVDAGRPTVVAATQEAFVPQMINLEVLGGVSFKKGCYPGQEVVARSQYLGKLRRRMGIAHVAAIDAAAGGDVFADGEPEPVGKIVLAAGAPEGGMDLLFEAPVDRISGLTLRAMRADGAAISPRPLPYALVDVTA